MKGIYMVCRESASANQNPAPSGGIIFYRDPGQKTQHLDFGGYIF
jgi:hypothetical protein